jgi:hypothetical protein
MSNNTSAAVTITGSGKISAIINGSVYSVDTDHKNYQNILQSVREQDWDKFLDLVDLTRKVRDYIHNSDIEIKDGVIVFNGEVVHNTLTKRVIDFMQQDLPFKPLLNFLGNLMENPSKRAVDELYDFLEVGELPITEDGHFLAFKNVRSTFMDIHSNSFNNAVGSICQMKRNQVDEDKDRTCSYGLHFCSISYLPNFLDSDGGKTMIVKINPRDVVAIPADYNNTKGRTCRYEVVGEYTDNWREKLGRNESGWDSPLYSSDGGDYQDDCDNDSDDCCHYDGEDCDCNQDEQAYQDHLDKVSKGYNPDVYGIKPNGHKFHNMRDENGKFIARKK